MKNSFRMLNEGSLLAILFITLFYNLSSSFFFNTDYTRDLYRVLNITQGHPTLIGPPLSVGIFSAPYYYYFILPSLLLSGYSPYAYLIFNAIIFLAGIIIISILLSKRGKVLPILGMILLPVLSIKISSLYHPFR